MKKKNSTFHELFINLFHFSFSFNLNILKSIISVYCLFMNDKAQLIFLPHNYWIIHSELVSHFDTHTLMIPEY